MSKPDDSPFRSGHTAALDLDKFEKDPLDDDVDWNGRPKESKWASNGWAGGAEEWPEQFGGGGKGGTAALDLSEFDPGDVGGSAEKPWEDAFADEVPDMEAFNRNNKGRRPPQREDDDIAGFFGGPSGTQALDIGGFDDEDDAQPFDDGLGPRQGALKVGRRAERSEDYRDPHSHFDQRGSKSYEGGQGDPIADRRGGVRGESKPAKRRGSKNYEPEIDDTPKVILDEAELAPHERTMAIGVEELRRGAKIPMEVAGAQPSTEALDFSELRKEGSRQDDPGELFPDEKTQAIDPLALGASSPNVTTTEFDAPPGLRRGKATPDHNVRTAAISSEELQNYQANEVASDGHLLIFVPGNPPVEFTLRPGVTNIGRERTNHLVLSDPYCSRKHLRIKCQDGRWEVRDNGSDNGTLLRGGPMAKQQDIALSTGDEIKVGSTVLRFVEGTIEDAHRVAPATGPVPQGKPLSGGFPTKGNTASIPAMAAMEDDPVARSNTAAVSTPKKSGGPAWPLIAILLFLLFGIGFLVVVLIGLVFLKGG